MNMDIRYSNIFLTTSVQVYTPPRHPPPPFTPPPTARYLLRESWSVEKLETVIFTWNLFRI